MASHASETAAPAGPAPEPHTDAYMDMDARRSAWRSFGKQVQWQSLILLMCIGYAVFTITMHVNWLAALIGFGAFGIAAGLVMNMGGAWIATVVGLCVLGLFIQAMIALSSALLS